jgi:hypothetical protein
MINGDRWLASEKLSRASDLEERVYGRIFWAADDYGRFYGNPRMILARCFPLVDRTVDQVREARDGLHRLGLIVLYTVRHDEYVQITNWNQRVRAAKSKFPAPDDGQLSDIGQTSAAVVVDERRETRDVDERTTPTRSKKPSAPDPEGFLEFWKAYPQDRRKGRYEAVKAWRSIRPTPAQAAQIMASLESWKRSSDWQKGGGKYIPWPQKFLNRRRWEETVEPGSDPDELPRLVV